MGDGSIGSMIRVPARAAQDDPGETGRMEAQLGNAALVRGSSMDTGAGGIKYPGRTVAVTYMDTPRETRRSSLFYLWSIPREIFRHPNNRNHRIRALGRSVLWQAYKRLV